MLKPLMLTLALVALAAPGGAQFTAPTPPRIGPAWNPAAAYVTPGQDERGYRAWYGAANWRPVYVRAFNDYLVAQGVAGILPTWQLLRTASDWQKCFAEPFEVPPSTEWPNIVETLKYIHAFVVPAVGPVEAVSVYRNPALNACAGGAQESAHRHGAAVDLVPLRPITREALMAALCAVHARRGEQYRTGLGFYPFLRFHIDSVRYRQWGGDQSRCGETIANARAVAERTAAANAAAAAAAAAPTPAPAATSEPQTPTTPAPTDPLAPQN